MRRAPQFVSDLNDVKMTVLCAWCGVLLCQGGRSVSHGICNHCVRSFERDIDATVTSRVPTP